MGAFAVVTLRLVSSRPADAQRIAGDIIAAFPGTRAVELAATRDAVTFELHFPGNLSALVRRLRDARVAVAERADISVPVESLLGEPLLTGDDAVERIVHGAEVWDAEFTRAHYVFDARLVPGHVEASIVSSTEGVHQVYDAMLTLGLVANPARIAVGGVR